MMYSVMKLSFTEKNVRKFVLGLMTGKEKVKKLQVLPSNKVETVKAWDGKDKKV